MPVNTMRTRIRAEFLEMPGLRLTADQAQRLCGVGRTICQMVLDELVNAKFLGVSTDGHYALLTETSRSRPAKADLITEEHVRKVSRAS